MISWSPQMENKSQGSNHQGSTLGYGPKPGLSESPWLFSSREASHPHLGKLTQTKVAHILFKISLFKVSTFLPRTSLSAPFSLAGFLISNLNTPLLKEHKLYDVLHSLQLNAKPDTHMYIKPLKWMLKLDKIWPWFLDRHKGPPELNQGY